MTISAIHPKLPGRGLNATLRALFGLLLMGGIMFGTSVVAAEGRFVAVLAQGTAKAPADMARFDAGVLTDAPTAEAALAANAKIMANVTAALAKLALPPKDAVTLAVTVGPRMALEMQSDGRRTQKITGYQASNNIRITLRAIDKLGPVIGALAVAGANQIGSVEFDVSNRNALAAEARAKAVAEARARAEVLAKAAGATLGPVISIEETPENAVAYVTGDAMALGAEAAAPPVLPGDQTVTVAIRAVWKLAD